MNNLNHFCEDIPNFPINKYLQLGTDNGKRILILGEAPAPNGWRLSGRAFYTPQGKLLPTGKNLNLLLEQHSLSVEKCSFTELVKCYVGKDRHLLSACAKKCWPILLKQIEANNFDVLIILGVKTLELFNKLASLDIQIGQIEEISLNSKNYKVLALYHPSPISPTGHKNNMKIFEANAQKLAEILRQNY